MKHSTTCKFCHLPITIEVDDSYTRDPYKIIPLACCDFCSDIRVERRGLEYGIAKVANLVLVSPKASKEAETARAALIRLTQKYAQMIARWHRMNGMAWDEEGVNLIMDKPRAWPDVLQVYWNMFRDWKKQQEVS
jgi:hypothetical protein